MLYTLNGVYFSRVQDKIAENLKYLVGDKSVRSIAKEIGIPQQTLHRYLHCEREIGLEN